MGRTRIDFSSGNRIKWPNKCAFCGAKSSDWAESNFSKVTGLRFYVLALGWTFKTKTMSYPVCQKHKRFCSLFSEPTKWTFTDTLLYIFSLPTGFALLLLCFFVGLEEFADVELLDFVFVLILSLCLWCLTFIFLITWKIISLIYVPIKLLDFNEISIDLSFRNDKFLQEFITINRDLVVL